TVGRICLDMLRARNARREHHGGTWLPEPLIEEPAEEGPEHQAVQADSIGLALLVVLESLTRRSDSRSCCTTSSRCRSRRSRRSWNGPRTPRASWPAGPASECEPRPSPTPTSPSSA